MKAVLSRRVVFAAMETPVGVGRQRSRLRSGTPSPQTGEVTDVTSGADRRAADGGLLLLDPVPTSTHPATDEAVTARVDEDERVPGYEFDTG